MKKLTKRFLQQEAFEYQTAASKIYNKMVKRMNLFESTKLLIVPDWKDEIILSDDYRYSNAIQAYNEVINILRLKI